MAATATINSENIDLVLANMAYGNVNLQRAVLSNPDKFTIWLENESDPIEANDVYLANGDGKEVGLQHLMTKSLSSKIAWIKHPSCGRDEFYDRGDDLCPEPNELYKSFLQLQKSDNGISQISDKIQNFKHELKLFPCNRNSDNECIKYSVGNDNDVQEIVVDRIKHIVFKK